MRVPGTPATRFFTQEIDSDTDSDADPEKRALSFSGSENGKPCCPMRRLKRRSNNRGSGSNRDRKN